MHLACCSLHCDSAMKCLSEIRTRATQPTVSALLCSLGQLKRVLKAEEAAIALKALTSQPKG